jgi:hypothetical protein
VKIKVIFYVDLQEVAAPWEEDWDKIDILGKPIKAKKSGWEGYHRYREKSTKRPAEFRTRV